MRVSRTIDFYPTDESISSHVEKFAASGMTLDEYVNRIAIVGNSKFQKIDGTVSFENEIVKDVRTHVTVEKFRAKVVGSFVRDGDKHYILSTDDVVNMSGGWRDCAEHIRAGIEQHATKQADLV